MVLTNLAPKYERNKLLIFNTLNVAAPRKSSERGCINMKREELKNLNVPEEAIDKIMALNGTDIEKAKSSVGDVDAIKQENESLKSQMKDRDKDLKDLQKQVKDNEDLSGQFSDLQEKYKNDTESYKNQLQQTKLNGALNTALSAAKVRNPKAAEALLDMDKIKLTDDGKLDGLDDQLASIKKSDGYLFDEGTHSSYGPKGGDGSDDTNEVQTLVDAFKE